jgi:hypothetical protein
MSGMNGTSWLWRNFNIRTNFIFTKIDTTLLVEEFKRAITSNEWDEWDKPVVEELSKLQNS